MQDRSQQVVDVAKMLIGQRVHEVICNINAVPYLSLKIGAALGIVDESEYSESKEESRPCQPLRAYELVVFCPHALMSNQHVIWCTDYDYDLESWAFHKGNPIVNMDIVPFMMGGYITAIDQTTISLNIELDNGVVLVTYPFRTRPIGAVVEEFYKDPDTEESDDLIPNDVLVFDNSRKITTRFYNGNVTVKPFDARRRFVYLTTGRIDA